MHIKCDLFISTPQHRAIVAGLLLYTMPLLIWINIKPPKSIKHERSMRGPHTHHTSTHIHPVSQSFIQRSMPYSHIPSNLIPYHTILYHTIPSHPLLGSFTGTRRRRLPISVCVTQSIHKIKLNKIKNSGKTTATDAAAATAAEKYIFSFTRPEEHFLPDVLAVGCTIIINRGTRTKI